VVSFNLAPTVISDYRLREGQTGHDAITALREKTATNLPCIIITGDTASNRLRDALTVDAVLLHKPVVSSQLNEAMVTLLRQQQSSPEKTIAVS